MTARARTGAAADHQALSSLRGGAGRDTLELQSCVDEHRHGAITTEFSIDEGELIESLCVAHPADGIDAKKLAPQLEGLG